MLQFLNEIFACFLFLLIPYIYAIWMISGCVVGEDKRRDIFLICLSYVDGTGISDCASVVNKLMLSWILPFHTCFFVTLTIFPEIPEVTIFNLLTTKLFYLLSQTVFL